MVVTILATDDGNDSVFGRAECGSEEHGFCCGGCEYETTTAMGCCSRRGLDDDDDTLWLLLTVVVVVNCTTELLLLRDVVGMEGSPWRRRPT